MLTRSVVACMLSGTLVSSILLGDPLVKVVHARELAVKKPSQVSQVPGSLPQVSASPQRRRTVSPRSTDVRMTAGVVVPSTRSSPQKHRGRHSTIRLGAFSVRAYTHYHSPGATPNKTATGTDPVAGRTVAVDPRVIPLGSKIHIEGVGERIAEDTGGRIRGKRLDLFLPSVEACRQFGVQMQEVRLLTK
jgi:3D (Asp-Asp-Asp) domain-containing protein